MKRDEPLHSVRLVMRRRDPAGCRPAYHTREHHTSQLSGIHPARCPTEPIPVPSPGPHRTYTGVTQLEAAQATSHTVPTPIDDVHDIHPLSPPQPRTLTLNAALLASDAAFELVVFPFECVFQSSIPFLRMLREILFVSRSRVFHRA